MTTPTVQYIVVPTEGSDIETVETPLTYDHAAHLIGVPIESTPAVGGSILLVGSALIDPAGYRAKPFNEVASRLAGREVRGTAIVVGPGKYSAESHLTIQTVEWVAGLWRDLMGAPDEFE